LRLISVAEISKFHWLRCQSTALVNLFDKQLKHLRLWQADSPANSSLTKISEPAAGDDGAAAEEKKLVIYSAATDAQVNAVVPLFEERYGIEVEDTVAARLHFANGANGVFFATNCDYTNESVQIKVACEKASFLIEDDALFRIDADGVRTKLCENEKLPGAKFYFGASHGILINKFYRAIENNTDDYIHVRDAEMSIRLIDAIHASSKAGHPVAP